MKANHTRRRDQDRPFSATLADFRQAADEIERFSLPELRNRAADCYTFLVQEFLPHAAKLTPSDYAEADRLTGKLDALRERLAYSYFGPEQLWSLQAVFLDLHQLIERELDGGDDLAIAVIDAEGAPPEDKVLAYVSGGEA